MRGGGGIKILGFHVERTGTAYLTPLALLALCLLFVPSLRAALPVGLWITSTDLVWFLYNLLHMSNRERCSWDVCLICFVALLATHASHVMDNKCWGLFHKGCHHSMSMGSGEGRDIPLR